MYFLVAAELLNYWTTLTGIGSVFMTSHQKRVTISLQERPN